MKTFALPTDIDTVLMVLTALAAVTLILCLARDRTKSSTPKKGDSIASRWRVFRIRPEALHSSDLARRDVVAEESGGVRVVACPYPGGRWEIAGAGSRSGPGPNAGDASSTQDLRMEITRRGLLTSRYHATLDGRDWLSIRKRDRDSTPEIRFHGGGRSLQVAGSPLERDYEIRRGGKLLAMVSRPASPGSRRSASEYVLEVLKSEDPRPLLTLVLCMEAALPDGG